MGVLFINSEVRMTDFVHYSQNVLYKLKKIRYAVKSVTRRFFSYIFPLYITCFLSAGVNYFDHRLTV